MATHPYKRFPFTPFPAGVFAIAFADELAPGSVTPIVFMGKKIALFRTRSGKIGAIDAYCPHLGADLTQGCVIAEKIQCPFHGLCFDTKGQTKSIADQNGSSAPFQTSSFATFEQYGLIFLVHHARKTILPTWDITEWGKPIKNCFTIRSHPQEILENSVDQAHFRLVHQYQNPRCLKPFQTKDTEFTIGYEFERALPFTKCKKVIVRIDIHAYGLGLSMVDIHLPQFSILAKQIVLPTPIDGELIHVRTLTSVKMPEKIARLPHPLKKLISNALSRLFAIGFKKDFIPDISIWENKKYISNPRYLAHDGDFQSFREWAAQFYLAADEPIQQHRPRAQQPIYHSV